MVFCLLVCLFVCFLIEIWLQPCRLARWSVVWTFAALIKAMLVQPSVPGWFVNSGVHLWPGVSFVDVVPTSHCYRTLCPSAGISATAEDEFLFVCRWRVLQKAAATKRPHRFHKPMPTFVASHWHFLLRASAGGKYQHEDVISLAYWMYQNTEPEIHVSAEFPPHALRCIYLRMPVFSGRRDHLGCVFLPRPNRTVGEAEDERKRAVMRGERKGNR